MAKYEAGDKVRIDGVVWTLGSWPLDDDGPFTASRVGTQNNLIYGTFWTGMVQAPEYDQNGNAITIQDGGEGEPVQVPADVEPVADGEAESAGDVAALAAQFEAELAAADDQESEAALGE